MKSFFAKIGSFFKGVFTNPNSIQVAQSTIRMIGPIAVGIVSVVDPQDAPLARQVIYEVMTDLGALDGVLAHVQQSGDKTALGRTGALVEGITENLQSLLTGAHVKNAALTATVTTIIAEVSNIATALPNMQPLAVSAYVNVPGPDARPAAQG